MKKVENCFFIPPEAITGGNLAVRGSEAKHIAAVLRYRPGDTVVAVDGCGGRYKVELTECSSAAVVGEIRDKEEFSRKGPELWLAVGLIRAPRMDVLVEKCTELGVHTIVPLCTRRSLSSKGVSDSRLARWQRIAAAAMTQSLRVFLPSVREPVSVEYFVQMVESNTTIVLADPRGKSMQRLGEGVLSAARMAGCIGPEGGFSPDEIECLMKAGAIPVFLDEARLRTETAAIAVLDRLNLLVESVVS